MKLTTVPLELTIQGRKLVLPAVINEYNKNSDWWEGFGLSVRRRLDGGKPNDVVYPHWTISLCGPWYDDSNPSSKGNTLEEAVSELEQVIRDWVRVLISVGV